MHVLGIDAGGTKTMCLLADEHGAIVSEARGPGANLHAAGELAVEKALHDVMERAIGDRAIVPAAICLGIAGVDRDDEAQVVRAMMRRIGYKSRILVVNDALIALVAGAGDNPGIVVIAGTGSIVYGRNTAGEAARAGGWGHMIGDDAAGDARRCVRLPSGRRRLPRRAVARARIDAAARGNRAAVDGPDARRRAGGRRRVAGAGRGARPRGRASVQTRHG